ncbi:hypothetical protein [Aquibium oceanicum]|uniref:hypothetical protein n=1 Tax=Aquibium oceanicum TaxID=1670800 RepID=UPI0012FFA66B|nr:hypothetical protein [Aquibium oceanicum]
MNIAGVLQAIGLLSDIVGFSFLVWEVGFSHRLELLSNPEKPIAAPDMDRMKTEADSYKADQEKRFLEIRERGFPAWKVRFGGAMINCQIARKYAQIEREKLYYQRRLDFASTPRSEAIVRRRIVLISGAFFVFLGFILQLVGTLIALGSGGTEGP